ncbi:MAG: hypothetical protein LN415_00545 [Candidatus Thermoplasmatota archaeon]|nr:hypothetical protein [Candidatus Thermoplasmatota archaeon]
MAGTKANWTLLLSTQSQERLSTFESSNDALSWIKREMRYERKFSLGKRFIPGLFPKSQSRLDQIALLVYASKDAQGKELGGGYAPSVVFWMRYVPNSL